MTAEDLHFQADARSRPPSALDLLVGAIDVAPEPRGRDLVLEKSSGAPRSTEAGSTVARQIELEITTKLDSSTRAGSDRMLFERNALRTHAQITPTALEVVGSASGSGLHR